MRNTAVVLASALLWLCIAKPGGASEDVQTQPFEISLGSAVFNSPTNAPGVEVKGKSTALFGRVEVSREASGLLIQNIEATIPTKTFATGMKVRDEHLRKYIFTTSDGKEPDLRFEAERAVCPAAQGGHEFTCALEGTLSIRGTSRPFQITLGVKDQSGTLQALRAAGDGVVKLSTYGITPPTQFSVRSSDEVKLHLEFTCKMKAASGHDTGSSR
jgi:polyisoprenoid-binding protein YceI